MSIRAELVLSLDAFVLGWIAIDILANLLIEHGQSYTKIRFFGGNHFASSQGAVIASYAQVIAAMLASLYIGDWFFSMIKDPPNSLVPITLVMLGVFHLYILAGLPYNVTHKRASPSLLLFGLAYLSNSYPEISAFLLAFFQIK